MGLNLCCRSPAARSELTRVTQLAPSISKTPMKRLANPQEIADAIAFLCSERSSYMTGVALTVSLRGSLAYIEPVFRSFLSHSRLRYSLFFRLMEATVYTDQGKICPW